MDGSQVFGFFIFLGLVYATYKYRDNIKVFLGGKPKVNKNPGAPTKENPEK